MGWGNFDYASAHNLASTLRTVPPSTWCQAFYLFAAAGVIAVAAAPREARTLLVDYGARKSHNSQTENREGTRPQSPAHRGRALSLIAVVTSWGQVPHAWFSAFYVVSLVGSLFWLVQYFTNGTALHSLASNQAAAPGPSATLEQVTVAWAVMFLQACRRLYEHATVLGQSNSKMWVVHWLLGLCFYLFTSVAIWAEGSSEKFRGLAYCTTRIKSLTQNRSHFGRIDQ
ncbi:hypothetical protein B0T22DRAFT_475625 [Podospora appendiculata]|uniref:Polyprenal reductase n=1 Tax=Podospora appendiculata TaxID=314037 RepID=A0AAE1CFR2_9PEZI|nr:hypothetical protein B0T22DRAFT_475625 [Podospora appendiculata]